jgi:hypothetical protein
MRAGLEVRNGVPRTRPVEHHRHSCGCQIGVGGHAERRAAAPSTMRLGLAAPVAVIDDHARGIDVEAAEGAVCASCASATTQGLSYKHHAAHRRWPIRSPAWPGRAARCRWRAG